MDERVRNGDTYRDIGTPCNKCTDGTQHESSCIRVKLETDPSDWTCEDRMPNVEVQEDERRENACLDESAINLEASAKKSRSLRPRKSRTIGASSTLTKRQVVLSEARQVKRETSSKRIVVLALRAPEPNNNSQVQKSKRVKKHKSINSIVYSEGTFGSQVKEPESNKGKSKASEGVSVTTQDQSSSVVVVNQENFPYQLRSRSHKCGSPYWLRDRSQKLGSQVIENVSLSIEEVNDTKEENSTDCLRDKCSLLKPSTSSAANLKPKRKFEKVYVLQKDEVEKSPSLHEERKGKGVINSLCPNGKEKKGSQQDENPKEASTSLIKGPTFDERSHLRDHLVYPMHHYAWRGKFEIHNNEGIARSCYWFQAHASNRASVKVHEMVAKLIETIKLEELPRLEILPSQFKETQVTENDIGLYFFAEDLDSYNTYYSGLMNRMTENDLALKGNIDGVELLIFPSNILPKGTQRWNQMLYFWGVFKGRKVNNSASIPVSNSSKPIRPFDLNAYPEAEDDDEEGVDDGIPEFDGRGSAKPSGGEIVLVGDSSNGEGENAKEKREVDLLLQIRSPEPNKSVVGIEDNVGTSSSTFAPPSSAVHAMDQIGCQIAQGLVYMSHKEHARVMSKTS